MFEEYIGKHLTQRHKYEGLKYARKHGFPELLSRSTYGILFKDEEDSQLVFRIWFESQPVYDRKGNYVPGRSVKTITQVDLIADGCTQEEIDNAQAIAKGYLELVVVD